MEKAYSQISIPELPFHKKGKVRYIYEVEDNLLIKASDRISAFDFVLPSHLPQSIIEETSKKYLEIYHRLTGKHEL